ncbi:MAG: hypothetical protein WDO19_30510 [Bacteroidota bacterium]
MTGYWGISDSHNRSFITISLYSTIYYHKDHENSSVDTGLVQIATAPALLRALQTAERFDTQIPLRREKQMMKTGK